MGAGLPRVEVTSFVSARWIPQLADADALCARLPRDAGAVFSALVPNEAGYERLRAATSVAAAQSVDGDGLVKLEQSPFYAEGGGQVADSGSIRWDESETSVIDV